MEELDLKEIFNIFWEKKTEIILIIAIFVVLGLVYSYVMVTPEYTSYTTLLLTQINSTSNDNSTITQSDLTLNSNLISTYSELIKSKVVLREVIRNLNISISEEEIRDNISVKAVADTELIEINVTNDNPTYATNIANEIADVFSEKISEIYNIDNVYVVDEAEKTTMPSNVNHVKDVIIFAFIGVVIACGYALLYNMLDNGIKTEQDIEKVAGLLVLATIPDCDVELKKGGRKA